MKVDAQIVEEHHDGLSPIWKGILTQSFTVRNFSNQKPMANTVSTTRRTTLIATTSFPSRNFQQFQVPFFLTKISLRNYHFGSSVFIVREDLFVRLFLSLAISHQAYQKTCQWSVHSCKIDQSATQFLGWWGGVYYKRVHRSSFLVLS